jgi:type III restriction enzyme
MGFEQQESEAFIELQPTLSSSHMPIFTTILQEAPDLSVLTPEEQASVSVQTTPLGIVTVSIQADKVTEALIEKVAKGLPNKQDKAEIIQKAKIHIQQTQAKHYPSERGEVFSAPQLCLNFEDGAELAEKELFLPEDGWSLLDYPTVLDKEAFTVHEQAHQYAVDIAGQKIIIQHLNESDQLSLDGIATNMTENDLCRWMDKKLRQPDIKQEVLLEFLRRIVQNLLSRSDMDMPTLVRGKFILEKVIRERIELYRQQAYDKGFQTCLFGQDKIVTVSPADFSFSFDPNNYPANLLYGGPIQFEKHYYPRIGIMNGEETECAQAIDRNPLVHFWVRNLERQPHHAFWLPTSKDKFYPDFVAQLTDGRLLVIEYKGEHLKGDDSKEKELLGQVWAEQSGHLFLMAWKKDDQGRDVYQQINNVIKGT